jgi:hypothetical protein
MSEFYGYTLRKTGPEDTVQAFAWTRSTEWGFWLRQEPGRESFIVFEANQALGFYQVEHVGAGDQVRLHMQASPLASPKNLLRAITRLVPLIEKALAGRGVRAIFFTSKSSAMAHFMARLGYEYAGAGGADGMIMAKGISKNLAIAALGDCAIENHPITQSPDHSIVELESGAGVK